MRISKQLTQFATLLTPALLACAWGILPVDLLAAEQKEALTETRRRATVVRVAG